MEMTFKIDRLKEGMKLAKLVKNPNTNSIIAPAGTVLTKRSIQILESHGVSEVDIDLSKEEFDRYNNPSTLFLLNVDNGIAPTISRERVAQLKNSISPIRKGRENLLNVNDVVTAAIGLREDITTCKPNPYSKDSLSYKLSSYTTDTDAQDAAVRIATYATMVANAYNKQGNLPRDLMIDETQIALAALLHNYGSICKYDEIREAITIPNVSKFFPALTETVINKILDVYDERFIPVYSYTLLRNKGELFEASVIKKMIINARENRNATGPLRSTQLRGNSRSVMGSLIISLCALYDEALSNCIKNNSNIAEVDDVISRAYYSNDYDRDLIDLFRKCIPLYPVGTKVMIYNEDTNEKEYAVVIDNSFKEENYRNPVVLTVPGNQTIDLSTKRISRITELVSDTVEYATLNLNNASNTSLGIRGR